MSELNEQLRAAFDAWWHEHADPIVGYVENQIKKQAAWDAAQWAASRATPAPQAAPSDDGLQIAITALRNAQQFLGKNREDCFTYDRSTWDHYQKGIDAIRAITQAAPSEPILYARQFDLDTRGAGKPVLAYATPEGDWNVPIYAAHVAAPQAQADAKDANGGADGKLHGFDRDDLEAIADGLESGYETAVDVGGSPLECDGPNLIASTTACAARFIRAALAAATQSTGDR